ncbi:MAG: RNA-binding S4 domain-containing protein [Clostridia bacterium]
MRIDKFLKISRIIKRRTIANEACDNGRIKVNNSVIKASYNVKENDIIELSLGAKLIKVKVVNINEYAQKADAPLMYEIME